MNKTELVRAVAAKSGNHNTQTARFVDDLLEVIEEELRSGGRYI